MITEVLTEENMKSKMDYLDFKVSLLAQIGLTDEAGVKTHLKIKSTNAPTEMKRRIQIDNAARKIMMDFYDGDKTFVRRI